MGARVQSGRWGINHRRCSPRGDRSICACWCVCARYLYRAIADRAGNRAATPPGLFERIGYLHRMAVWPWHFSTTSVWSGCSLLLGRPRWPFSGFFFHGTGRGTFWLFGNRPHGRAGDRWRVFAQSGFLPGRRAAVDVSSHSDGRRDVDLTAHASTAFCAVVFSVNSPDDNRLLLVLQLTFFAQSGTTKQAIDS